MGVVVVVNFGMTLKAKWNGIFNIVISSVTLMLDMVEFHFNPTKTMTNATASVTLGE